jgi:hypothetical protein
MTTLDIKKNIKLIRNALKYDHLYSSEELQKLKVDLRNLQKTQELITRYRKNGFGQYVKQPVVRVSTQQPVIEPEVVESVNVEVMESAE